MEDYLSFDAGWHANIGETAAVMAINEGLVDLSETPYDDPDMPEDIENPGALLDHLPIGKGAFYRVSDTGYGEIQAMQLPNSARSTSRRLPMQSRNL